MPRGRGRGRGRRDDGPDVRISKAMSSVLRHRAVELGIPIEPSGFVRSTELARAGGVLASIDDATIVRICDDNDKKRYSYQRRPDGLYVRANQGHSMPEVNHDELLEPIRDPREVPVCVHGTTMKAWELIRDSGLNKMTRNHIHFAVDLPGGRVLSGARMSSTVAVFVDVATAMAEGIKFYRSDNGVVLSDGIDGVIAPRFFSRVVRIRGGVEGEALPLSMSGPAAAGPPARAARPPARAVPAPKLPATAAGLIPGTRAYATAMARMDKAAREGTAAPVAAGGAGGAPAATGCPHRFLLVFDIEANCIERGELNPQEIVELPVVVVDTTATPPAIVNEYRKYVKPITVPVTEFCTTLTGITPAMVEDAPTFVDAWANVNTWLDSNGYTEANSAIVTCGDWDLAKCLPKQAGYSGVSLPNLWQSWVNIKHVFDKIMPTKARGMKGMLDTLGMELVGRHHSGLDDARNIARITINLLSRDARAVTLTRSNRRGFLKKRGRGPRR